MMIGGRLYASPKRCAWGRTYRIGVLAVGGSPSWFASFVEGLRALGLKGTPPGDLPIELPTDYELAINLKAGKTLGVAIPQSLVLRADKVIE